MSGHTERQFGRNVTNAVGSKSVPITKPAPTPLSQRQLVKSVGVAVGDSSPRNFYRQCAPEGYSCNGGARGTVSHKRRRTGSFPRNCMQVLEEREGSRAHSCQSANSACESSDSMERCFDEDAVLLPEGSSVSCADLLSAVAGADVAVMVGLQCKHRLSSNSPPPPPPVPLLFSLPDAL